MEPSYDRWIADLEDRKARLREPEAREVVDAYIEHLRSEQSGDLERLMAHMAADVVYRRFGAVSKVLDHDGLRAELEGILSSGGFPEYEMDTDHFLVDSDSLAIDGVLRCVATGAQLLAQGKALPAGGGRQDRFLVETRLAAFFRFRESLLTGEDTYRDPATIVRMDDAPPLGGDQRRRAGGRASPRRSS